MNRCWSPMVMQKRDMKMCGILTSPPSVGAAGFVKARQFQEPTKLFASRLEIGGVRNSVSWNVKGRMFKGSSNGVCASTRNEEGVPAAAAESPAFADGGGLEATLNNLSKWVLAAALGGIIMWRHDGEAVWGVMGSVLNVMLSITLKQILNQERPNSTLRSDPGMPSSHAQSITYTTLYIIVSLVEWYRINALTTTLSGMLIILASYFTWLRVSQNLHTVSQVVVGAIIGSSFSFLWFWSWKAHVLNLFVSFLWVRLLIIVAAIGFFLNHLYYTYRSSIQEQ